MKTTLAAIALAAMPVQPAAAITFPSFTTIYLGSGVYDEGGGENAGIATSIQCSNVSGQATCGGNRVGTARFPAPCPRYVVYRF